MTTYEFHEPENTNAKSDYPADFDAPGHHGEAASKERLHLSDNVERQNFDESKDEY